MGCWQRLTRYLLGNWGDSRLSRLNGSTSKFPKKALGVSFGWYFTKPQSTLLSRSLVVLSNRATVMTFSPNGRILGWGRGGQRAKDSFLDIKPVTINSLEKKSIVFWAWTGNTDRRMNKASKKGGSRKAKIWFGTKPRCAGQAAGCRLQITAFTPL